MTRAVFSGILILVLLNSGPIGLGEPPAVGARDRPHIGPVIIDPNLGEWNMHQRRLFRAAGFDLAKVHLPPGFNTTPSHVEDLIGDGASVIMLKTEDCMATPDITRAHLVGRGFLDLVDRHPNVRFVMQVGNEPELCDISMSAYVQGLIGVGTMLRPEVERPNLEWVAGLPMNPEIARDVIDNSLILRYYDGVGTNMLGHFSLIEERHNWHEIVDHVLDHTDADLWITEIGINHPPMDKAEKAAGILEYVDQLPPERVQGVGIFVLAHGSRWPQYEITEAMMPVFADREDCRYYLPTDRWLCAEFKRYWDEYGGLAIFGYPISEVFQDETGNETQYFERSRFEHHPGVWPEKHDVLLGHLGWWLAGDRDGDTAFQPTAADDDCVHFQATRQNLCDEFLEYWNGFGGLPIFGYPISQRFTEDGLVVQYFERARFEHHPGVWPERFDVLQGLLGSERYMRLVDSGN